MFASTSVARPLRRRPSSRQTQTARLRLLLKLIVLTALVGAVMTQVVLGTIGGRGPAVVVLPGQTLWSIASRHYPQSDPRAAVAAIEAANHLRGSGITPGERLLLPPL